MSTDHVVDWTAALADIEARIAKLQGLAEGIREMLAASSGTGPNWRARRGAPPGYVPQDEHS